MSTMVVSFCITVLSFNFFMFSYQLSGVNRLVLNAPLSLFESAISMYNLSNENTPYFDKNQLKENITYYFSYHMPRYTDDYSLSFYYYNTANHSLDLTNKPKAVEVTLKATLVLFYSYSKTMYYEIRSSHGH